MLRAGAWSSPTSRSPGSPGTSTDRETPSKPARTWGCSRSSARMAPGWRPRSGRSLAPCAAERLAGTGRGAGGARGGRAAAGEAEEGPVARALRGGETVRDEEIVLVRKYGKRIAVEANAGPVRDRDGGIVAGVLVFQDVTERKQAEVALREADRRKDEFLAMLAHARRNPLAPILHAVNALRALEPGSTQAEWC